MLDGDLLHVLLARNTAPARHLAALVVHPPQVGADQLALRCAMITMSVHLNKRSCVISITGRICYNLFVLNKRCQKNVRGPQKQIKTKIIFKKVVTEKSYKVVLKTKFKAHCKVFVTKMLNAICFLPLVFKIKHTSWIEISGRLANLDS